MLRGDEDIYRALEAGAVTYLLKDTALEDLTRVIREVHAGKNPEASPEVKAQMAARAERPVLTPREVQVLELVRRGLRNREIGASLGISEETVQSHVRSILSKLEVPDRTAAVDVGAPARDSALHIGQFSSAGGPNPHRSRAIALRRTADIRLPCFQGCASPAAELDAAPKKIREVPAAAEIERKRSSR